MKDRVTVNLLVLAIVVCYGVMAMAVSFAHEDEEWGREHGEKEWEGNTRHRHRFLLQRSRLLVKTKAGEMRVVKSVGGKIVDRPINVGFITMEPNSLFVPQYLDSTLILFVQIGRANVGLVHESELIEKQLKAGDVYRIPAGCTFYLRNRGEGQRLHLILNIDAKDSLRMATLESFFIGGGNYPRSVLAGFDYEILTNAFNVSSSELRQLLTRQKEGPIVYANQDSHSPKNLWTEFLELKEHERLQELKKLVDLTKEEESRTWSWRKLWEYVFGSSEQKSRSLELHDSYNLYDTKPNFENNYGSSLAVNENDYSPLKKSGIGVYLVNLTAGSMLAPHVNPTAAEYGIVVRGSGTIQIVFPNGTLAMKAKLKIGRVFWVPRYFPFCQVASNNEPLELFGFTTSSQPNQPQFMAGSNSVLQTLRGPELAAAFGVSEGRLKRFVNAQQEAVILPYMTERTRKDW